MTRGFITPPWADEKTEEEHREEQQKERFQEHLEACQSVCDDCGQMLWKGNHIADCPEELDE